MPHVVTTKRKYHPFAADSDENYHVSRRVVATPEQVLDAVPSMLHGHSLGVEEIIGLAKSLVALPESGGTVGSPDGTTIEVEAVTRQWLWREIRGFEHGYSPEALAQDDDKLCDACNKKWSA